MKMAAIFVLTWIGFCSVGAFAGDRHKDYQEANRRYWERQQEMNRAENRKHRERHEEREREERKHFEDMQRENAKRRAKLYQER
ncbi:hypothetical protein PSH92_17510 [Pseudomonas beijingensis]|uniref:Uncharacterized protein n=1 Tax=Pseudomonas beijingensis TaxID=2954101 RepID=A0ABY9FLB3_9PSED|nr:hypothetical protein [Pseudomonas sp. FP2034]WLH04132.1 hypothetical protein PSH92_17510 [Pseudomonas sp. FP2034]